MFRSINSTSALSLGIWVSVPESGRREGLGNQGGGTLSIYPMEQWQLEVWAHALGVSISSSGIFRRSSKQCIFGLFSSSRIFHYTGKLRSYLWSEDMSSGSHPFYSNSSPSAAMGPTATRQITVARRSRRYRNRWQWLLVERGVTELRGTHSFTPKSILNNSIAGFE